MAINPLANPPSEQPLSEPPAVSVRQLRRTYGRGPESFEAVRGIDFDVESGSITAILGVNGAGKTSTLELLEGLAPVTSGEVRVLGLDPITDRAVVRRSVGVLLQTSGFSGDLTVAETLSMWRSTLSNPLTIEESLQRLDLTDRRDVMVRGLSGGERRRLDLACALMGRPRLVILDEPTTGLDPESRRRVWQLLRDLRDQGTTVLFSTHYLDEAEELADQLFIMAAGRIVREGTVADIVADQPAEIRFVTPTQPLPPLPGTAGSQGRHTVIECLDLQHTLTMVLDWAREQGLRLAELSAHSASLESVFLRIADQTRGHEAPAVNDHPRDLQGAHR